MGGLATPIATPGLTSRRRYILQHAGQQGVALQAEAVETLAQAADGYRTLEGWISRLALEGRLKHEHAATGTGRAIATAGQRSHLPTHDRFPLILSQSPQSWLTKPNWSSHS